MGTWNLSRLNRRAKLGSIGLNHDLNYSNANLKSKKPRRSVVLSIYLFIYLSIYLIHYFAYSLLNNC